MPLLSAELENRSSKPNELLSFITLLPLNKFDNEWNLTAIGGRFFFEPRSRSWVETGIKEVKEKLSESTLEEKGERIILLINMLAEAEENLELNREKIRPPFPVGMEMTYPVEQPADILNNEELDLRREVSYILQVLVLELGSEVDLSSL